VSDEKEESHTINMNAVADMVSHSALEVVNDAVERTHQGKMEVVDAGVALINLAKLLEYLGNRFIREQVEPHHHVDAIAYAYQGAQAAATEVGERIMQGLLNGEDGDGPKITAKAPSKHNVN
jgi:hypothetical protein